MVIWVIILPPVRAAMPPSIEVSIVLPAAPRLTRPSFIVIGPIVPTVTVYCAALPTGTLARSTASGVGGPCAICAEADRGSASANSAAAQVGIRREKRDMRGSISEGPARVHAAAP